MAGQALLGLQATAGLSPSVFLEEGLNFVTIPEGNYEIGGRKFLNNPARRVSMDSFELADTVLTNRQMVALLKMLKGKEKEGQEKSTIVTATLPNHQAFVLARGTKEEIKKLPTDTLEKAAEAVLTAGLILETGGFETFDIASVMQSLQTVTLEQHWIRNGIGADQPALVSGNEASAIAALLDLELPIGERWEAACGDLGDEKYLNVDALREVAHFYSHDPKHAPENVKSRKPNKFNLYGMLGNVWEWMANPCFLKNHEQYGQRRVICGGSWLGFPEHSCKLGARVSLHYSEKPEYYDADIGVRLARSKGIRRQP